MSVDGRARRVVLVQPTLQARAHVAGIDTERVTDRHETEHMFGVIRGEPRLRLRERSIPATVARGRTRLKRADGFLEHRDEEAAWTMQPEVLSDDFERSEAVV